MRIADNFYVYLWNDPQENNCNSIFINGKVPLLIDPGHVKQIDDLFARMIEDRLDPLQIKLVICTHAHPDHISGIMRLKELAKIAVSQQEESFIEHTGRPMYEKRNLQMPDYKISFYLKEGELTVGKHEFQVLFTPGHTPGGISIYWPRYKALFPGDVIFDQAVGRVDLPGGNAQDLTNSLKKLSELPIEIVVPGHGAAIQGAARVRSNFDLAKRMVG